MPRKSPPPRTARPAGLGVERLEDRVNPGAGRFVNGVFDFAVSVRFDATAAQLQQIAAVFQNASQVLADATDGQHRFGTVTLFNSGQGGEAAEFWVYPGAGRPTAPRDKYHVRGYHANLFLDTNFAARQGPDGDAYTVAHTFAHLAYGLEDQYAGPAGPAEGAPVEAEGPGLTYTLMDNYFTRGGRAAGGGYTLNEFSTPDDHDRDGDTWQSWLNGESDWETIAGSRFPAVPPPTTPVDFPPPAHTVAFPVASGLLQSVLTLDNSSGTAATDALGNTRLSYTQKGARAYVDYTRTGNGVGVVTFADQVSVVQPLTAVTDDAARTAIKQRITAIAPATGFGTDLRGGITAALNEITRQPARTWNEAIVAVANGPSSPRTDPTLYIAALLAAGVPAYTIAAGNTLTPTAELDLLQIANATGGRYFRTTTPFDTQNTLLRLSQELDGNGLAARSPQAALGAAQPRQTPALVEAGAAAALFVATQEDATDPVVFTVTSPSGQVYTTLGGPGVEVVTAPGYQSIRILNPEPGSWAMTVSSAQATRGRVQEFAFVENPGTLVHVAIAGDRVTFPEPMVIRASPHFRGLPVTGAAVTGTVTRPDGAVVSVTLFDDGLAGHGDRLAGDGVYSALFTGYNADGSYTIDVAVDGSAAVVARGEDGLFPGDPASPFAPTPFARLGSVSAYVSGVGVTSARPDVFVTLTGPTDRLMAGESGVYRVQLGNSALTPANGVVADLHLPYGLTIGSAAPSAGTATVLGNNVVRLNLPSLRPAQVVTLDVVATATGTDAYFAWADVRQGTLFDLDPSNNRADLILPAKTPPAISALADATAVADRPAGPFAFTVSDAETHPDRLTMTAATSNPSLFPSGSLALGGSGAARTLTVTPSPGQTGTGAITLTVTDPDGMSFSRTFFLTIVPAPPPPPPPNAPPTISDIPDQFVPTNGASAPIPFTVGDPETPADQLAVEVTTSNVNLIPTENITLGGSGANRTVTVRPIQGQTGLAVITVSVRDGSGRAASDTFAVTVSTPPNAPPTIAPIPDRTITAGTSTTPIPFTVGDAETPADQLRVTAESSNTTLVPAFGVIVAGAGATRTVNVVPVPGRTGTATITLTVTDAAGAATTESFNVVVVPAGSVGGGVPGGTVIPPTLLGYRQFTAGADRGGSPTVRFYDPDGSLRFATTVFVDVFTGGVRTAAGDFNGDGVADLVVGTGPGAATRVRVLDGATQAELFAVEPFEARFTGGVYVAAGDVTGDGRADLVITPDEGGGPRVRVFDGVTFGQMADFFGIDDPNFRGGARAAVGDINGDGTGDLIVAAGFQGGPRVAGFDGRSLPSGRPARVFGDFFAFEETLRNGVFIAAGDLDGDGFAELVAGGGPGGGPRVTAFSGKALLSNQQDVRANFFAGDPANRGGVRLAVKDLDFDTRADLVVGSGSEAGSRVTAYSGRDIFPSGAPAVRFEFDAFPGFAGGVFVG